MKENTQIHDDGLYYFRLKTQQDVMTHQNLQYELNQIQEKYKKELRNVSITTERRHRINKIKEIYYIKNISEKKGLFFVLQDETDKFLSYCFKTNIITIDDEFLKSDIFKQFKNKMETDEKSYSGNHFYNNGNKWFGYLSYEIENFYTAIKMWYDFFEKHNKLHEESKIFITEYKNKNIF